MTIRHAIALASVLAAGFAGTALAEPAPQGDVSQINGQLVPVGDHGRYQYSFKRWNLSTNPLGWVVGFYGVSGTYGFHPNLALRVDANYYSPVGESVTGTEFGVGLPIYFRAMYRGAFLEPGFVAAHTSDGDEFDDYGDTSRVGPQMMVGWHWMWDSGFNIAVAAGVGRDLSAKRGGESEIFPNGYLRFGYAF